MPVIVPGRRPAYPPIGRLRTSPLSGGKKNGFVNLNLTAMVDMFTILVIFLIQLFKTTGEVELSERIKVPNSQAGVPVEEPGTVVQIAGRPDDASQYGILLVDSKGIPEEEMGDALVDLAGGSIPGLVKRLTEVREFDEKINPRDMTQAFEKPLIIQADIKADFRLIRRVIGSANEAGWAKMKFITQPVKKATAEGEAPAAH